MTVPFDPIDRTLTDWGTVLEERKSLNSKHRGVRSREPMPHRCTIYPKCVAGSAEDSATINKAPVDRGMIHILSVEPSCVCVCVCVCVSVCVLYGTTLIYIQEGYSINEGNFFVKSWMIFFQNLFPYMSTYYMYYLKVENYKNYFNLAKNIPFVVNGDKWNSVPHLNRSRSSNFW